MAEGDVGTRVEHLGWCKERALAYVDRGDLVNALASMVSDLTKHSETDWRTADGGATAMGHLLALEGSRCVGAGDVGAMRRLIEGFR